MDELDYWKLKCAFLQLIAEENQLSLALQDVGERRNLLLRTHGLDGNVRFDDTKFTVETIKSDGK